MHEKCGGLVRQPVGIPSFGLLIKSNAGCAIVFGPGSRSAKEVPATRCGLGRNDHISTFYGFSLAASY